MQLTRCVNAAGLIVLGAIVVFIFAVQVNTRSGPGPVGHTKVTLRALAAVAVEYEQATNPDNDKNESLPRHDVGPGMSSFERFALEALKVERCRLMLENLGRDRIRIVYNKAGDPIEVTAFDGWGIPMQYFDGRSEITEPGMVKYKEGYFASAGPDGEWGNIETSDGSMTKDARSKDNLYSFELK